MDPAKYAGLVRAVEQIEWAFNPDDAPFSEDEVALLRSALEAIAGPNESHWMHAYRAAGGGYEGLQAIARAALDAVA
jgi:hypothetical protein